VFKILTMNEDVLTRTPPKYDLRLKYGTDQNQFGDLRLPKGNGPHPLLLMIHGGYWRAKYDLLHAGHLCAALASDGIATFNLEYRRVGNPGGGWPGTFEDVRNGFRYIQQVAHEHRINAAKSLAMGHSAGGELALCLAHREPGMFGAISLAGVLDMQRAYELHLSNDAAVAFLGGSPKEVPEHFREASPIEISIPKVRQLIVHGIQDDVVPIEISRNYERVKKKRGEGENVSLMEIDGAGHYELIDPESKAWTQISKAIKKMVF